jgi:hypothetical protein
MSVSSISSMQRRSRVGREALSRVALTTLGALGLILSPARTSDAQTSAPQRSAWELRVTGGAFVPTGSQRNTLGDAHLTAAQLSWLVRPSLAVTGTFGWARSRDVASAEAPKLDVFTSDVGVEARAAQWFGDRKVTFSPFVGAGVGARSYNYRKLDVDATTNLAAYGAVGGVARCRPRRSAPRGAGLRDRVQAAARRRPVRRAERSCPHGRTAFQ